MTPEQEILADNLVWVAQQSKSFAENLKDHEDYIPVIELDGSPSAILNVNVLAFLKRFEMMQDQVSRKLFRSVLAVKGTRLRTKSLADVVQEMGRLGIVDDLDRWETITRLRNVFAHDYLLTFNELVPLVNEAWALSAHMIEMVGRVETYVADHALLAPVEE